MANATEPLVGRSVGHEWAVFVATSGHFCWPPTGSSKWPLTRRTVGHGCDDIQARPSDGDRHELADVCVIIGNDHGERHDRAPAEASTTVPSKKSS